MSGEHQQAVDDSLALGQWKVVGGIRPKVEQERVIVQQQSFPSPEE